MTEAQAYRLPHTVEPQRYQLEIAPDLAAGTFHGHVTVEINVKESVQIIMINGRELTVQRAELKKTGDAPLAGTISYQAEEEQIHLQFEEPVTPGIWQLQMEYEGVLSSDLRGFYRTTVQAESGETLVFACTQCEATDARRVFPCWDEPDFKARFAITLIIDPQLTALSNEKVIADETDASGKRRIQFAQTIPMSTYLVALIVGPLKLTAPEMAGHVPVRVAARPSLLPLTRFAQKEAVKSLDFFRTYFGIDYPGNKLDHVAIPDFAAGAMENFGCVTYREEALALDEHRASPIEKMNVTMTIAHETAHMWFGDMVTMHWWNGLWLNEAFATFMQLLATDALHPEWDIWTGFGVQRTFAFAIDGLEATRPIEFPVKRPVDAEAMFDVLTYDKGASVLRMLEQYLQPSVFQEGIMRYLQKHQYHNTETDDLWNSLQEASRKPIGHIMGSWVFQPGYPLVQATWDRARSQLILSQKRFQYQGEAEGEWKIPIVIRLQHPNHRRESLSVLLEDKTQVVALPDDIQWIMVNSGGWGFYRVVYDNGLWKELTAALGELTALERLTLLDDVWAGAITGDIGLSQVSTLWRALSREHDPDVWSLAMRNMTLLDLISDSPDRLALSRFVRQVAQPLMESLGWDAKENEDVKEARLRANLVLLLGTIGDDTAIAQEAYSRLMAHLDGTRPAAPELLSALVKIVARRGGDKEWNLFYEQFKQASTPQDTVRYLFALGHFPQDSLVRRAFELYLSSQVRIQDGIYAMGDALRQRHTNRAAWEFIEVHWDDITAKFPPYMMQPVILPLSSIVEDDLAPRMAQWFETHPIPPVQRLIAQSLEFQRIHQAFARRIRGQISKIFAD